MRGAFFGSYFVVCPKMSRKTPLRFVAKSSDFVAFREYIKGYFCPFTFEFLKAEGRLFWLLFFRVAKSVARGSPKISGGKFGLCRISTLYLRVFFAILFLVS